MQLDQSLVPDIVAGRLKRLNRLFELARPFASQPELILQKHVARVAGRAGAVHLQLRLVCLYGHAMCQVG